MNIYKIYYIIIILIVVSCNNPKEEIFWVSGFKNEKNNVSTLLIQKSDTLKSENFVSLNKNIDGFNFEEGYLKKIIVKVHEDKYALIKELEKKKDYRVSLNGKWKLEIEKDTLLNPTLNIMLGKMYLNGNSYCNNYKGNIQFIGFNSVKFDKINSTKKFCKLLSKEEKYLNKLGQIETYLIKGNYLYFYNKGNKILSFKKY